MESLRCPIKMRQPVATFAIHMGPAVVGKKRNPVLARRPNLPTLEQHSQGHLLAAIRDSCSFCSLMLWLSDKETL